MHSHTYRHFIVANSQTSMFLRDKRKPNNLEETLTQTRDQGIKLGILQLRGSNAAQKHYLLSKTSHLKFGNGLFTGSPATNSESSMFIELNLIYTELIQRSLPY